MDKPGSPDRGFQLFFPRWINQRCRAFPLQRFLKWVKSVFKLFGNQSSDCEKPPLRSRRFTRVAQSPWLTVKDFYYQHEDWRSHIQGDRKIFSGPPAMVAQCPKGRNPAEKPRQRWKSMVPSVSVEFTARFYDTSFRWLSFVNPKTLHLNCLLGSVCGFQRKKSERLLENPFEWGVEY